MYKKYSRDQLDSCKNTLFFLFIRFKTVVSTSTPAFTLSQSVSRSDEVGSVVNMSAIKRQSESFIFCFCGFYLPWLFSIFSPTNLPPACSFFVPPHLPPPLPIPVPPPTHSSSSSASSTSHQASSFTSLWSLSPHLPPTIFHTPPSHCACVHVCVCESHRCCIAALSTQGRLTAGAKEQKRSLGI